MKSQNLLFQIFTVLLLAAIMFACNTEQLTDEPSALKLKNGSVSLSPTEQLGKLIFFDTNLSDPPGMSCATCHGPEVGYTGPNQAINAGGSVYEGAVSGSFGNRKPPSVAYAGESPVLYFDADDEVWVGGMFWDGRATGWTLGDPLAEQAQGPFLNPVEQHLASPTAVIDIIKSSDYAELFEDVYGEGSLESDPNVVYENIAFAVAAYERSTEVTAFTSKYDAFLEGKAKLTGLEMRGMELFNGKAKCAACHMAPLFTDFTYDNVGVPRNPANPWYSSDMNPDKGNWTDSGLGGFLKSLGYEASVYSIEWGKHKVPTLRNVGKRPYYTYTKAYMHNGVFKSLIEVVHFYNKRDNGTWPAPEINENINSEEMGNLGLNLGEEIAIVAFLETLSDGYIPKK